MKTDKNIKPPKFFVWILSNLLSDYTKSVLLGDLEEEYFLRIEKGSKFYADCWYIKHTVKSIPKLFSHFVYWGITMFKNYFKIGFRNLSKQKSYSFINVIGLVIGLTSCMIISLFVNFELSYDKYHLDHERIFRVALDIQAKNSNPIFSYTTAQLAPTLKDKYPEVELAARSLTSRNVLVRKDDKIFYEDYFMYADSELLKILNIPLLKGNVEEILNSPQSIVVSEDIAAKYFGEEDPIGNILVINNSQYEITGLLSNSPSNTHLKYQIIASMKILENAEWFTTWSYSQVYTYVKLKEGTDPAEFENKICKIADNYIKDQLEAEGYVFTYFIQNIVDLHLNSYYKGQPLRFEPEPIGNYDSLIIFSIVGLLMLVIASINFMNLTTARSANRAKEVGMRKVIGGKRIQLIFQFLGESATLSFLAFLLSLIATMLLLPLLNEFINNEFKVSDIFTTYNFTTFIVLTILMGILAGSYPAFILSGFRPINVLRSSAILSIKGTIFRKILVVGQFAVSIILIIGTITAYRQIRYMTSQNLGFEKEQKIVIPIRGGISIRDNFETVKSEFLNHSSINGAAAASNVPGRGVATWSTRLTSRAGERDQIMYCLYFDYDVIDEYGIELIAGRNFSKERSADIEGAYIINEAAVEAFGFNPASEILGQRIISGYNQRENEIIGVTKNFHYMGLQNKVEPLIIEFSPVRLRTITLTINTNALDETIGFIEAKWNELFPRNPFEYYFLDEVFDRQYQKELQQQKMFSIFSFLALLIACMGLLGLSAFAAVQRTKEIGIRKVLGASVTSVLKSFSKEFMLLILIANILAWPAAWYLFDSWLQDFAYRIDISIWTFIIAGSFALIITLITISSQAYKAANTNPVEALKYE
ncbi:ABC transporter permease [Bacteroidota bacterium]